MGRLGVCVTQSDDMTTLRSVLRDEPLTLSRFGDLFVIARSSSFTYKSRAVDVKQVGRELGVRYVLEGSVRKAGNRIRRFRDIGATANVGDPFQLISDPSTRAGFNLDQPLDLDPSFPEPGSLSMLVGGLACLGLLRLVKKRAQSRRLPRLAVAQD
jgi:hypothetical protein